MVSQSNHNASSSNSDTLSLSKGDMLSQSKHEWKEYKISEVGEVVGGGTPSTEINEYWNGDIPWLTPRDLSGYKKRAITRGERFISRSGLENSNAKLLPKGTVLLTSRAPIGYLAIAENYISTNQGFQSIVPNQNTISEFLYYLLKANVNYLISQGEGTTFGELAKRTLKELKFNFPPLPEQRAIASILSSLDDKIDLLHRQNKTLEQLAETLFRQWFVEEAEGKLEIGEVATVTTGKGLKREEFIFNGIYPILGANGEIGRTDKYLTDNKLILTGRVGTLGKVYISEGKVWISDNVLIINPFDEKFFYPIYFFLKTIDFENLNVGSTQPLVTQTEVKKIEFKLPNKKRFEEFINICAVSFKKISENKSQIRTLTQLRDTLLPKLMSGEIRVEM